MTLTILRKTKSYVTVQNHLGKKHTIRDWVSFWATPCSDADMKILLKEVKDIFDKETYAKLKEKIAPTPKQKKAQASRAKAARRYFSDDNPYLKKLIKEMQSDPGFCPWVPDKESGENLVTAEVAKLIRF